MYNLNDALRRIAELESENALLRAQIEESTELVAFLKQLNSDKYGNILDMLLEARRGTSNNTQLILRQLMKLVRDTHIEPMLRPNDVMEVRASDIENYNYIGTPFTSVTEIKKIRVVSPGWVWKDRNIRIARPKVVERI